MDTETLIKAVPIVGFAGMLVAGWIFFSLTRQSTGSARMVEIAQAIQEGAMAFLKREYRILVIFVAAVAVLLGYFLGINSAVAFVSGAQREEVAKDRLAHQ